jgi:hypothetical protein
VDFAIALGVLPEEIAPCMRAIRTLRNKLLHDTPHGSVTENDVKRLLSSTPSEVIGQIRNNSQFDNAFVSLPQYQRDLRMLLLMMYAICVSVTGLTKERDQQPSAEAPNCAEAQ